MWWMSLWAGCTDRVAAPEAPPEVERFVAGSWTQSTPTSGSISRSFGAALLGEEVHALTPRGYVVYGRSGWSWTEIDQPWTPASPGAEVVGGSLTGALDADGAPCVAYAAVVWSGDPLDLGLDCGAASVAGLDWYGARANAVAVADDGPHLGWTDQYRSPDDVRRAIGPDNDLAVAPDRSVWAAWTSADWLIVSDLTGGDWDSCSTLPCPGDTVLSTAAEEPLAIAVSDAGRVAVVGVTHESAANSETYILMLWQDGSPTELVRWARFWPDLSNPVIAVDVAYDGEIPYVAFSHEDAVEVVALDGTAVVREVAMAALPLPWNAASPSHLDAFQLEIGDDGAPRLLTADYWHDGIRVIERSAPMVEPEAPVVLGVADLLPGGLVVTEILANPAAADDAVGEWIEVHVPGGQAVDLDGLVVEDEAGGQGVVVGPLVVAPGGYAVLGRSDGARFAPAEVAPAGFYGDRPALNNAGGDTVTLRGPGGVLDQTARYARARAGTAWQLSGDATSAADNDDPTAWCRAADVGPGGDRGTPGASNPGC